MALLDYLRLLANPDPSEADLDVMDVAWEALSDEERTAVNAFVARFASERRDMLIDPTPPARVWTVQWREASWPAENWMEIDCVSEDDAIQAARRIYRGARSGGRLVPAIRVMDGIGSTIKGGEFDGCHSRSVYYEDSPEITRYWRVVYGPKQEAFVGANVPVWRVIGTLKSEEINPANIAADGWYLATHGPLASLSPDEVADACAYYGEHKAEIDAIIAARAPCP